MECVSKCEAREGEGAHEGASRHGGGLEARAGGALVARGMAGAVLRVWGGAGAASMVWLGVVGGATLSPCSSRPRFGGDEFLGRVSAGSRGGYI